MLEYVKRVWHGFDYTYLQTDMNLNNSIKHIKLGVVLSQVILLFLTYSCETYHLANGKKYRNLFPVKDEHYISDSFLNENRFDLKFFLEPDTNGIVQLIFPEDIDKILNEIDEVLLIFYYPNCRGADSIFKVTKFAEEQGIPYILISDIYSPKRMKELNIKHNLKNNNLYIIPTLEKSDKIKLKKRLNFIKELCPNCYTKYMDELAFLSQVIIKKNKDTEVYPVLIDGYVQKETPIEWIKEKYEGF